MATSDAKTMGDKAEDFDYDTAIDKMTSAVSDAEMKPAPDTKFLENNANYLQYSIHGGYDCTLVRTVLNGEELVNEFYILQFVYAEYQSTVWMRNGQMGEVGKYKDEYFSIHLDEAVDCFRVKYEELTGQSWDNRKISPPYNPGKYTPVDYNYEDGIQLKETLGKLHNMLSDDGAAKMARTTLVPPTLEFVQLTFTEDQLYNKLARFDLYEGNEKMKDFKIGHKGVKYMPLGTPTNAQLARGLSLLKEIEGHLVQQDATTERYRQLSSDFYTAVPCVIESVDQAVIDNRDKVKRLRDVLLVLGGVTDNLKTVVEGQKVNGGTILHPLDVYYRDVLKCQFEHLPKSSDEFKMIVKNLETTGTEWNGKGNLLDVWKVDREAELTTFAAHKDLGNRRLLWRACLRLYELPYALKEGYTIRRRRDRFGSHAGWGLYFRPCFDQAAKHVDEENQKDKKAALFLMEVALGNPEEMDEYDRDVCEPEDGYDSIVARGKEEPDPSQDVVLKLDGNDVVFSLGEPIAQEKYAEAEFSFTKYVLFNESQYRIRYLCLFSREEL